MLTYYTGCQVDAYELQADLHETAKTLTSRCDLDSRVTHIQGDFLDLKIPYASYDAIVSWLVFLHIKDRKALFRKCANVIKEGGVMYVEDFVLRDAQHFTRREETMLAKEVYVDHPLPTLQVLQRELDQTGFDMVDVRDMTETWANFVVQRFDTYKKNFARHQRVHGKDGARDLLSFFGAMKKLFLAGHLGGVAYTARRRNHCVGNTLPTITPGTIIHEQEQ